MEMRRINWLKVAAGLALLLCAGSTAPPKRSPQTPPSTTKRAPTTKRPTSAAKRTATSRPAGKSPQASPSLAKGGPGGDKSTSRPAASQPAVPAFEPLMDAAVGEWAVYTSLDQCELRYDITRVTGALVTTRITFTQDGQRLAQPTTREDLLDFDPLARRARGTDAQRTMTSTKLKIAGRTWNAQLYEDRWIDEDIHYVRRTWVSADATVFGLLKMELQGDKKLEARLELKSFGQH